MDTVRFAQAFGVTTSLVLAGINIGASQLTIPLLYERPIPISTPIFRDFYLRGAASLPPLGIASGLFLAAVAYLLPSQRSIWATAAVATLAQPPWTLLVMMGTNNRLSWIAKSKSEQDKAGQDEVVGLLKRWGWMNMIRGFLALTGGVIGLWGVMNEQTSI